MSGNKQRTAKLRATGFTALLLLSWFCVVRTDRIDQMDQTDQMDPIDQIDHIGQIDQIDQTDQTYHDLR